MKRLLLIFLLLSACTKKNDTQTDPDHPSLVSTNYIAESAVNMVSSSIDDQTNETLMASYRPTFLDLLLPSAFADGCLRAVSQSCNAGRRTLDYASCVVNNKTYQGGVILTYSQNDCSFLTDGDTVTRTYPNYLYIYGAHDGTVINYSGEYFDYTKTSYSGGTRLTRASAGEYRLDVLGRHSEVVIRNYLASDISMRTLSPVLITQGLSRSNRQLDGGVLEILHNLYQFKATVGFSNVHYASNCCYPVSGTVSVEYSGKRTGSSTVTFNGCGTGTILEDGNSSTFKMTYCE